MSKKIKFAILSFALATVVASSAAMAGCSVKTDHPRAKITISFNEVTYEIEYKLYRNLYPQTVQHFIELADNGFYDDMIIHDYKTNDWLTGAYAYNEPANNVLENDEQPAEKLEYVAAYEGSHMGEYLEKNSKEEKYYEWFKKGELSPSVYSKLTYDEKNNATVDKSNALPTLIGEFSENDHNIEKGALTNAFGNLKMVYYDKGSSNQHVAIENSFGEFLEHDYQYNCATSVFSIQVGNTSAYSVSKYCVFAKLLDDGAKDKLEDLTDAISDYINDVLGGSSSKFTSSATTKVDNLDTFAEEGGREIEQTFTMTSMPIVIKSVKITKY